ncbi:Signal peptidase I W [Pelotomaculum sp. FP]|uniref:signal peptidase I n=1 Tax=Pelotomaculum sp. FP TaxID=261474 RepID=UPI001101B9E5|nr:signal peptidase I [Pelotomaculum sp. FP]TEB15104.1 Signal peptidase I W [Pelotomaculum sp. FP]
MGEEKVPKTALGKAISVIGVTVCAFLVLVLIVNVTFIIRSYIYPDKVPDFFGYKPFIVLSGSMEPTILAGDLIVTKVVAPEQIVKDDIIAFRAEKNTVVTHRVTDVRTEDGLTFLTKGDANTGADAKAVSVSDLEGIYLWRAAGVGRFAMFLQTPLGMLLFVITPLCLFILYDITSRNRRNRKKADREAQLEAELAALRAAKGGDKKIEL